MSNLFDIQRDIISGLKAFLQADAAYTGINFYSNEIVFLQPYEMPAVLIYTFRNIPIDDTGRDTLNNHERNLEVRFELRGSSDIPVDYEAVADKLFDSCLAYKKANPVIKQIGNPTFQIGLDEKQPGEVAATLDIPFYYFSRKNRN